MLVAKKCPLPKLAVERSKEASTPRSLACAFPRPPTPDFTGAVFHLLPRRGFRAKSDAATLCVELKCKDDIMSAMDTDLRYKTNRCEQMILSEPLMHQSLDPSPKSATSRFSASPPIVGLAARFSISRLTLQTTITSIAINTSTITLIVPRTSATSANCHYEQTPKNYGLITALTFKFGAVYDDEGGYDKHSTYLVGVVISSFQEARQLDFFYFVDSDKGSTRGGKRKWMVEGPEKNYYENLINFAQKNKFVQEMNDDIDVDFDQSLYMIDVLNCLKLPGTNAKDIADLDELLLKVGVLFEFSILFDAKSRCTVSYQKLDGYVDSYQTTRKAANIYMLRGKNQFGEIITNVMQRLRDIRAANEVQINWSETHSSFPFPGVSGGMVSGSNRVQSSEALYGKLGLSKEKTKNKF
ncbi:hypothetical protein LXL04_022097 [Taraxacum kok-saghyz]